MHVPRDEGSAPLVKNTTMHLYADAVSSEFVLPGHPEFMKSGDAVAHNRSLASLKMHLGEMFDLEPILSPSLHCQQPR